MATAYHNEALRKQRVLERKQVFQENQLQRIPVMPDQIMSHSTKKYPEPMTKKVVVKEGWIDPFKDKPDYQRKHRHVDNRPEDKMYPILNPAEYKYTLPKDQLPMRKPHFKV